MVIIIASTHFNSCLGDSEQRKNKYFELLIGVVRHVSYEYHMSVRHWSKKCSKKNNSLGDLSKFFLTYVLYEWRPSVGHWRMSNITTRLILVVHASYDVIEGYGDNDLPWMLFVDGYFMKILMTNVLIHLTEWCTCLKMLCCWITNYQAKCLRFYAKRGCWLGIFL